MPKSLLLADDSITIQKVVGITFAQEDYDITYTDNGEDAVKKAKEIKPDIVLADIIMPQKNGYEVCETIKKDPDLKQTPVLLLAGTFETFDESRGQQVGADGYIIKPFESQALIDKVNDLVGKRASLSSAPPKAVPVAPKPMQAHKPAAAAKPAAATFEAPASAGMFTPQAPPQAAKPLDLSAPSIPDASHLDAPQIDKRMEPMLEFEEPSFAQAPKIEPAIQIETPKAAESPQQEAPSPIPEIDILAEPQTETPHIDLSSPAEFIMDATDSQSTEGFEAAVDFGKREDFIEVEKAPTFDFVSGESDLKPGPQETEPVSPFGAFPDLEPESAGEETKFEQPAMAQDSELITQPPFESPAKEPSKSPDLDTLPPFEEPQPSFTIEGPEPSFEAPSVSIEPKVEPSPAQTSSVDVKIPPEKMEELVRKISQAVIEKIAWEVMPEMAERIIREEIKRLTEENK